jgi:hypothetical protein
VAEAVGAVALAAAIAGCGAHRRHIAGEIPARLLAQSRPIGRGPQFQPPASGPVIGACGRDLGPRVGVHVEVFLANRVVIIPAGIGARPPWRFTEGRISAAKCFGGLVTLEPTGLVLISPRSTFTLADLFRGWGQRLSPQAAVFVDGLRWRGAPGRVRLSRHAEIVVERGPHVPPHGSYRFPPGT